MIKLENLYIPSAFNAHTGLIPKVITCTQSFRGCYRRYYGYGYFSCKVKMRVKSVSRAWISETEIDLR